MQKEKAPVLLQRVKIIFRDFPENFPGKFDEKTKKNEFVRWVKILNAKFATNKHIKIHFFQDKR